jgi:hypothetical protein
MLMYMYTYIHVCIYILPIYCPSRFICYRWTIHSVEFTAQNQTSKNVPFLKQLEASSVHLIWMGNMA